MIKQPHFPKTDMKVYVATNDDDNNNAKIFCYRIKLATKTGGWFCGFIIYTHCFV